MIVLVMTVLVVSTLFYGAVLWQLLSSGPSPWARPPRPPRSPPRRHDELDSAVSNDVSDATGVMLAAFDPRAIDAARL